MDWFSVSLDKHLQSSMSLVKSQLSRLWSPDCLILLIGDLHAQAAALPAIPAPPTPSPEETNFGKKLMKQAIEKTKTTYAATTSTMSTPLNRLGSPASTKVALVCALYQTACRTLAQLRIDILNGLCFGDLLLKPLWLFLNSLGPTCGLKSFLELLSVNKNGSAPEFQMLILFCDTFSHLVTMLDDTEFYEQDKPFSKHEYAMLGQFLNTFLYRAVWSGL